MNVPSSMNTTLPAGKVKSSPGRRNTSVWLLESGHMLDDELLYEIRRKNLTSLAEELGGQSKLATKLGKSESQISHLIGRNAHKPIGEVLAREIEGLAGKPRGWLDRVQGVNEKLLLQITHEVDAIAREKKARLTDKRRTELISLHYKIFAEYGVDRETIRSLLRSAIS